MPVVSTKMRQRCRLILTFAVGVMLAATAAGCSEYDQAQKAHESLVTLQEADRQFSIEDTSIDKLPDDRAPIVWINRAIALMPHSEIPYVGDGDNLGLIDILNNRGRTPLLISYLQKALKDQQLADNPDLLFNLAQAQEDSGASSEASVNFAKALAAINKTLTTAGSTVDTDSNVLLERAEAEYYGGDRNKGVQDFQAIIKSGGDGSRVAENDLAYFMALDKIDLPQAKQYAEDAVKQARDKDDDDQSVGTFLDTLAWVLHQQGDNSNALLYEEEAASLDPLQAEVQYHLGEICKTDGRFFEARVAYRTAIKLDPYFPQARASLSSLPSTSAA